MGAGHALDGRAPERALCRATDRKPSRVSLVEHTDAAPRLFEFTRAVLVHKAQELGGCRSDFGPSRCVDRRTLRQRDVDMGEHIRPRRQNEPAAVLGRSRTSSAA
jgi:hypothetical protein